MLIGSDQSCPQVNHPFIGGVKLDITFNTWASIKGWTQREIEKRERVPMIAESIIVFDKTGDLIRLQQIARNVTPKALTAADQQHLQFMVYHANNKVERYLRSDPASALLSMHVNITDLIHYHYKIQQRWWLSNKRLLPDLRIWDPTLAALLEAFVQACDVQHKFYLWSAMIDHVLRPLGGRQPIADNHCDCAACRQDLAVLINTTYI